VRIVDPATPPVLPSRPIPLLLIGLGLLTGIIGGCVFAVVRHQTDPSVGVCSHAPDLQHIPQLGVVPTVNPRTMVLSRFRVGKRAPDAAGSLTNRRSELISWQDPESLAAESFRVTVASIMLGHEDISKSTVIVTTSPGPKEGKTTAVCNLAVALAEIGRRVLVLDADLRAPRIHEVFGVANSWGLSDLLQEQTPIAQYPSDAFSRSTAIPNVAVLPAGPPTLQIAALFSSSRLQELLSRLRKEFDTVLVDTAPMLQFSEARLVANLSDGVIIVLRSGKTERETAVAAAHRLEKDGSRIVGTILNDWSPTRSDRRYYKKRHLQMQRTWKAV
jgi:capsular exopolysaccharide synthesis family protein